MTEEHMQLDKAPFEKKYLGESRDDIVTLRINEEERAFINDLKKACRCGKDSTVIKKAVEYLHNEIHGKPKTPFYLWLSEARRLRDSGD